MASFKVACLQVNAGPDIAPNLDAACAMAREARENGADMVLMPENVTMMEWGRSNTLAKALPEAEHPAVPAFAALARETGLWLHGGTIAVKLADDRVANRTLMFDPSGAIVGRYDKIHMFDVDLGNGEAYRESNTFRPGDQAMVVRTPWGGLGLTICYDLRFPHLYRTLAKAGADFLTVPSAFTRPTGDAHWHVLLRARAIETGCWVFAPAQTGEHKGRETYGHALIVAPWGEVVADAGEEVGIVYADVDTDAVEKARGKVPSLTHDRPFSLV